MASRRSPVTRRERSPRRSSSVGKSPEKNRVEHNIGNEVSLADLEPDIEEEKTRKIMMEREARMIERQEERNRDDKDYAEERRVQLEKLRAKKEKAIAQAAVAAKAAKVAQAQGTAEKKSSRDRRVNTSGRHARPDRKQQMEESSSSDDGDDTIPAPVADYDWRCDR